MYGLETKLHDKKQALYKKKYLEYIDGILNERTVIIIKNVYFYIQILRQVWGNLKHIDCFANQITQFTEISFGNSFILNMKQLY